ncbi:diguanylate cyclase [Massilia sp. Root418]|uniref:sensor domain-containing diguanylate cyclase n=1 Tax=Massilia sp. Root418 TaxID=1736532 RepID=UPI0006F71203|nr:sensor domain-containing diguanylate cyclase [Massilia sp. Root418]KQX01093.1 diguanylate cyclase [Massilia sp. Root418]
MRPVLHFFLSFKFKITLLVTAMVLIAGLGVGGVSLLIAESAMRQSIARQELTLLSSAAANVDRDIIAKRQLLKSLTEQVAGREPSLDDIQTLLEAHGSLRDEFFNVTAFDAEGNLVASLRDRRAKGTLNVAARQYFKDTLRTREGVTSAPFLSVLSGKPVVALTQPLLNGKGEIIGVLLGAIELLRPSFSARLDNLRAGADGYLFIVSGDGTFVHHPNKSLLLSRGDAGEGSLVEAVLRSADGWTDELLDDGVPTLLAHQRLREADWTIALSYPIQSAFAPMASVRVRAFAAATLVTLLAGLFGWLLVKLMLRPLLRLHGNVVDIERGAADIQVFNVEGRDEFAQLSRAFFSLSQRRERAEQDLHRLATTDALTGINNRRMFDDYFPRALARAHRSSQQVGMAFLDIDHFKAINDLHGHAAGDAVLVEFARRLTQAVRYTDTVARLAGDEFVILFEQLPSGAEMSLLGSKIVDAMRTPFVIGNTSLMVTTSVGIALTTEHPVSADDVMRAADQALYGVKAAGRNGFAVNCVGAERVVRVRRA